MKIKFLKNKFAIISSDYLNKINLAEKYLNDEFHIKTSKLTQLEIAKRPLRSEIINFLISKTNHSSKYLEIGVRNKQDNFDLINSKEKYSVDPGYESEINDVDFKMTSDDFFSSVDKGIILDKDIKFDIIFIDGSHLAEQVEKDIENSLRYLAENGFIVMHDCNPPTEFHSSENYYYRLSPSGGYWNGTTWKAFVKNRKRNDIYSCCIDSDWGVGIISKSKKLGNPNTIKNDFYEYNIFEKNRVESLNLISYDEFRNLFC